MNITQLKQGSLNGLRRQTNECLDNAYNKGYQVGYDIAIANAQETKEEWGKLQYDKGLEDFENLFINEHDYEQFFEDTYGSKEPDYNLYDLVAKYRAKKVLDDFKKWKEEKKKAEEVEKLVDTLRTVTEEYPKEIIVSALSEFGFEVDKLRDENE